MPEFPIFLLKPMKLRYKIPLISVFTVLILFLAAYLLVTRTGLVKNQINRSLAAFLSRDYSLKVTVGKVSGVPWRGLVLENITVDYSQSPREYRMLSVDRLETRYRFSNLWHRRWIASRIDLYGVKAVLLSDETGRLLLPEYVGTQKGRATKFNFEIDSILVHKASFKLFLPTRSIRITDLDLIAGCRGSEKKVEFAAHQLAFRLPQEEVTLHKAIAAGQLTEGQLRLDSVFLKTDSSFVRLRAQVSLTTSPELSVDLHPSQISLPELKRLTGVGLEGALIAAGKFKTNFRWVAGKTELNGALFQRALDKVKIDFLYDRQHLFCNQITGKIAGADIAGSGKLQLSSVPERYEFNGTIANLNLARWTLSNLPSNLNGQVQMTGQGLSSEKLKLNLAVNLNNSRLDLYSFNQAQGSLSVDDRRAYFDEGFKVRYKNTFVSFGGAVGYSDSVNIYGSVQFDDLRDFWGQTFLKELAGRGVANFAATGITLDPNISFTFYSDTCWLYQLYSSGLSGSCAINRFLSRRTGVINLTCEKGTAWNFPFDSLQTHLTLDSNKITIRSVKIWNPDLIAAGAADLDIGESTFWKLTVDTLNLNYRGNTVRLTSAAHIAIDSTGYIINRAHLVGTDGSLEIAGRISYSEAINLQFSLSDLPIAPWWQLVYQQKVITGLLSLKGTITGDFAHPEITADIAIDDLSYQQIQLGELTGRVNYREQQLLMDSVRLTGQYGTYAWNGFLPIDLKFSTVQRRLLDAPQRIHFTATGERFDFIHFFIEDIEWLRGQFTGDVTITGTPESPQVNGQIQLRRGICKALPLVNPIVNLDLDLRLENEKIFVEKASGWLEWKKKRGQIEGSGTITVVSPSRFEYDLYVTGHDVPVRYEYDELEAIGDFGIQVAGSNPPLVTGDIYPTHLLYTGEFQDTAVSVLVNEKGQSPTPPWDLHLTVLAPNNCWVSNNEVNAEFKGELLVLRTNGVYNYLGDLEVIRGKYHLLARTFRIEQGRIVYDNIAQPNPKLDILVSTRIRQPRTSASGLASQPADIDLRLKVTGTLRQPIVQPTEGSPYSDQDVLLLLVTNSRFVSGDSALTVGASGLSNRLRLGGINLASAMLGNYAARQLGLEILELTPVEEGHFDLRATELTVGKYTLPNLYLYGRSRFTSFKEQEVGFEYRISRWLYLEGVREKTNLFRLNLNANWEY